MEGTITQIVDHLESPNVEDNRDGLRTLNEFIMGLMPHIVNFRELGSVSNDLQLFVSSQNNFAFNLALPLVGYYRKLHANDDEGILTCNTLLQGLLLLHPSSRSVFNRAENMKLILRLLDADTTLFLKISLITTIIHILLKNLKNWRIFEQCNGCSSVITKLEVSSIIPQQPSTLPDKKDSQQVNQQDLNFKIIEFLIFYLVDEIPEQDGMVPTKTVKEKARLFEKDFPDIENLIESLDDLKYLA